MSNQQTIIAEGDSWQFYLEGGYEWGESDQFVLDLCNPGFSCNPEHITVAIPRHVIKNILDEKEKILKLMGLPRVDTIKETIKNEREKIQDNGS